MRETAAHIVVLDDVRLVFLDGLFNLLLHGREGLCVCGIGLFLGFLFFGQGSIDRVFEADERSDVEGRYWLGNVVLALDHADQLVKFCDAR
jgi:hypothetical protein